jgi:hypothetical protein
MSRYHKAEPRNIMKLLSTKTLRNSLLNKYRRKSAISGRQCQGVRNRNRTILRPVKFNNRYMSVTKEDDHLSLRDDISNSETSLSNMETADREELIDGVLREKYLCNIDPQKPELILQHAPRSSPIAEVKSSEF